MKVNERTMIMIVFKVTDRDEMVKHLFPMKSNNIFNKRLYALAIVIRREKIIADHVYLFQEFS